MLTPVTEIFTNLSEPPDCSLCVDVHGTCTSEKSERNSRIAESVHGADSLWERRPNKFQKQRSL